MQLPPALLTSLQGLNGFDTTAFIAAHLQSVPVTSIRLNPLKPAELSADWELSQVPWCADGRYLSSRPFFTHDAFLHAGAYYVQEASSMFVQYLLSQLFEKDAAINILDLCAAPGGKSTLLAGYFQQALLVANEVIRSRVPILTENLIKWGTPHSIITNNDPAQFSQLPGFFDLMLVDAPCSGSGLFRKDPTVVEDWNEDQVELCARRQHRILEDVLPALREGGILLYATCSFSPEEDEQITRWLIREMDMEAVAINIPNDWGIVETECPGSFRFFPHLLQGEGFYISVLRKKNSTAFSSGRDITLEKISRQDEQLFRAQFGLDAAQSLFMQAGTVRLLPEIHMQAISQLAARLYIRRAGIELGELKGRDLIPSHEWAMMAGKKEGWPIIPVDINQALAYLGRQVLELPLEKGWNLISYHNSILGWVKKAGNRLNNYYPSEWRIRRMHAG
jgi:16S rRNA C967 or C1407 C5-methylase (RsmB/RsmF family)/NOL1/NOP2/fmu family ribosome biogenesis protein